MLNPPSDRLITAAQYTPHVHRTQYNAINPVLPSNSQAGKIIIITGASQGLGRQVNGFLRYSYASLTKY